MNEELDDGGTRLSHFESAQKSGVVVKELDYEPLPPICYDWWQWFCELNSGRQSNGMGVNVLSWGEIKAWCELLGNKLTPFDIQVIKQIDIEYVKSNQPKKDKK